MLVDKALIDEYGPAVLPMVTESGSVVDINNMPGVKKTKMIMNGELSLEQFTTPANIPGKKLKVLREAKVGTHEKNVDSLVSRSENMSKENSYQIGDVVKFGNHVSEVVETHPKNGVKIKRNDGKLSKWIHYTRVVRWRDGEE